MNSYLRSNDSIGVVLGSVAVVLVVAIMIFSMFVSTASDQPTNHLGLTYGDNSYSASTNGTVSVAESEVSGTGVSIGPVDWHSLGPKEILSGNSLSGAGKINTLAVDPLDSRIMYAGAGAGQADSGPFSLAGAFKTANGGRNWTPIDNGLTDSSVDVLSISPDNQSVIIAGTWYKGIFESLNQGSQWEQVWSAPSGSSAEITAIVWYNGSIFATSSSGILESENDGLNWTLLWTSPSPANDLSIVNDTWIVTLQDGSVYMKNRTTQLHQVFSEQDWTAQIGIVDPHDQAIAFLTEWKDYESGNMYETFDGGQTWFQCFSNTSGIGAIQYATFSPVSAGTLYFGGDGFTYEWNFSQTYSSSGSTITLDLRNGTYPFSVDQVFGYLAFPSSGALDIDGRNITVNVSFEPETTVSNASTVDSNSDIARLQNSDNSPPTIFLLPPVVNGSLVSINGAVNGGGNATVISVLWNWGDGSTSYSWFPATHNYSLPGTYLVTATATQTNGQTASASESVTVEFPVSKVSFDESGLPSGTDWYIQLLIHASPTALPLGYDTRMVYATANGSIYVTSDQGIYASWDRGSNWVSLNGNLSNSLITGFAISGNDIYTAVQDYSPIFSSNRGLSWSVGTINSSTTRDASGEDGTVAINPVNHSYVYLFTNAGLQVSANGGQTFNFSKINFSFAGTNQRIAFDPANPEVLIVAGTNHVWISHDYGKSFVDTGWPVEQPTLVAYYPANDNTIFVGNESGLYYTSDSGLSWNISKDTQGQGPVNSISFNPANPDMVLLGFQYSGGGLRMSLDGGLDFNATTSGMTGSLLTTLNSPQFWNYISAVSYCTFDPEVAAASTSSGIYISTDGGYSWQSIQSNLVPLGVTDLQWVDNSLYVSTYGEGIAYANISLVEQYSVTFVESGLPSGTFWSVTLDGNTQSSTSNTISFSMSNGTYDYYIPKITGYTVMPQNGKVAVNGFNLSENVAFTSTSQKEFDIIFTESGLVSGSDWYVTLNGTTKNSTLNEITFLEPNGTYYFSVGTASEYFSSPSSGVVTVNGEGINEDITFTVTKYYVNFEESGLPSNTDWSIFWLNSNNNVTNLTSEGSGITLVAPDGFYSFGVNVINGYVPSIADGQGNLTENTTIQIPFTPMNYQQVKTDPTIQYPGTDDVIFDPSNGKIYASNYLGKSISVIQGSRLIDNIPLDGYPTEIALDASTGSIYIELASGGMDVLNTILGSVHEIFSGYQFYGISVDGSNSLIYAGGIWNITVINGSSNQVMKTIPIYDYNALTAYDGQNGYLYLAGINNVTILAPSNDTVLGTINLNYSTFDIIYDPVNFNIYVTGYNENTSALGLNSYSELGYVSVIRGESLVYQLRAGLVSSHLSYIPVNGDVVVSNTVSDNIVIINGSNNEVIRNITTGYVTEGSAYDSLNGTLYVASWETGTVTIIPITFSNTSQNKSPFMDYFYLLPIVALVAAVSAVAAVLIRRRKRKP